MNPKSLAEKALLVELENAQKQREFPRISELCRRAGVSRSTAYRSSIFKEEYETYVDQTLSHNRDENRVDYQDLVRCREENLQLKKIVETLTEENRALRTLVLKNI